MIFVAGKEKKFFIINIIIIIYDLNTKIVNHLYVFYTVVMVTSNVAVFQNKVIMIKTILLIKLLAYQMPSITI